jgi:hypothetical protein
MPGLAYILKRLVTTQMALVAHVASTHLIDDRVAPALLEESKRIVADLQKFTDEYRIEVTRRPIKVPPPRDGC